MILGIIFIVVIFFPWIAVTARRLHDIGKSGWWQLISGIPYVGIIGGIIAYFAINSWRKIGGFYENARTSNFVLMFLGFLLCFNQISAYFLYV